MVVGTNKDLLGGLSLAGPRCYSVSSDVGPLGSGACGRELGTSSDTVVPSDWLGFCRSIFTSGFTGLLSLIPGFLALPKRPQPLKWEVFLPKLLLVARDSSHVKQN